MKRILIAACMISIIAFLSLFGGTLINALAEEEESTLYHKYYTSIKIEPGDSLWSIAARYNHHSGKSTEDYVGELKMINRLLEDTIHEGNYLTIVYYSQEVK